MRQKLKITPNTPVNESELAKLIMMGKSIRQIWVNLYHAKEAIFLNPFKHNMITTVNKTTGNGWLVKLTEFYFVIM